MNYIIERELVELSDKFFTQKIDGGIQNALSNFCHTQKIERNFGKVSDKFFTQKIERRFKKEKKCH